MRRARLRTLVAPLGASAIAAGCLVSFEDYPVEGDTGGVGGTADAAVGGSAGTGGTWGSGGAGGTPDGSAGTSGGSAGGGGSAGDGSTDAPTTDAPSDPCLAAGFWTEPAMPVATTFTIWFKHVDPLACVEFHVTCSNGAASLTGLPDPDAGTCPGFNCWRNTVANCFPGPAHVEFVKDKDLNGSGDCNASFPGSPGTVVASCDFVVGS